MESDQNLTAVQQMEADVRAAQEALAKSEAERKSAADAAAAAHAEAVESKKQLEAVTAELAGAKGRIVALEEEKAALTEAKANAEADAKAALDLASTAEGRAKVAEGLLARDPEALRLVKIAGCAPIAGLDGAGEGAASGSPASLQVQWAEAMKKAGGDYVKARRDNPELFAKLVPGVQP
jgi:hypothetical protein